MLADELDYVIGVDTHRDEHALAVVAAPAGAVVAGQKVRADARGDRAVVRFAGLYARGRRAWAIEGSGSYGAGLTRYLADRGETVLEVSRTPRSGGRLRGQDDALDAARTARAALASGRVALPRAGERREALRLVLIARRSAVDVRREALSQLRAVIVTAPERLRQQLRGLPSGRLLERCSRLRQTDSADAGEIATRLVLRSLARRIEAATLGASFPHTWARGGVFAWRVAPCSGGAWCGSCRSGSGRGLGSSHGAHRSHDLAEGSGSGCRPGIADDQLRVVDGFTGYVDQQRNQILDVGWGAVFGVILLWVCSRSFAVQSGGSPGFSRRR
jgi:hypothetical protein